MEVYINVFVAGVTMGWGPCLSFCAPVLLPYVAATQKGWLEGLKATLVFSISRIVPYAILSSISAVLGQYLIRNFYESRAGLTIQFLVPVFILLVGLVILIGKSPHWHICQILSKHISQKGTGGVIFLGLLIGILPCMPLLGLLTYIAFVSQDFLHGVFLGLTFGLGTLISPLLLFGSLAGGVSSALFKRPLIYKIFTRVCGLVLIYLGTGMLIRVFIQR